MLNANYAKVGEYAALCEELVAREAHIREDGKPAIVSEAAGVLDFVPTRTHPRNVVEGAKPRVVGDLRAPRDERDGGGQNSVNAGIDLADAESFDPLELPTPLDFAAEVDILRAMFAISGLTIALGKSDYARYYRQLACAVCDYWAQAFIIDVAGVRTDRATTFGGGAACHRGNDAADLILEIVVDEFLKQLAALEKQWTKRELELLHRMVRITMAGRPDRRPRSEDWERMSRALAPHGIECTPQEARFTASTTQVGDVSPYRSITKAEADAREVMPKVRAVQRRRRLALSVTHPELTGEEVERQCRPLVMQVFFDDSLFATAAELLAPLVAAMLLVADDIGLELRSKKST